MAHWLDTAVFYEIYPQSFRDSNADGMGDINGIIEKLDYVKDLGCDAIWLNPLFESPFGDAGYDVSDYYTVAPRYGTNDDLARLFREVHSRGMKILLDLVPGHTSVKHKWFMESMKAEKNEYTDRYVWTGSIWEKPGMNCILGFSPRNGVCAVNFFSHQHALNYGFYKPERPWQQPMDADGPRATLEAMKDIMRDEKLDFIGLMVTDENDKISEFQEKPKNPKSNLASMGIYIFNWDVLKKYLEEDEADPNSKNDFGMNIIPALLRDGRKMYAYHFNGYWRDVGTIDSLWEANMEVLDPENSGIDIFDKKWKIYSRNPVLPAQKIGPRAVVQDSLITEGCQIYGRVQHSVLSAGVTVEEGATVEDAVLMDGVVVKAGAVVKRCILAEDVVVGAGAKIGGEGPIAHVGTGLTVGAGATVKEGAKVFDSVKEGEEVC